MYSRSAKGGEKGDPNRNPWLAKMATVLPNNLDTETKTSNCTPKEIYVEMIKMSSPSQNNILNGSMSQTQNKNQKNPTHEKPMPATVIPNNLDTD